MKRIEKKSHWKFDKHLIISLLFILICVNINAQVISETIEKTVGIDENTEINIKHSGSIDYRTWDKNQLKVIVHVDLASPTSEELNVFYSKLKEKIELSLSQLNQGIVSRFSFDVKKFVVNNDIMKIKLKKDNKTYRFSRYNISMTVYAPQRNNLKINIGYRYVNFDAPSMLFVGRSCLTDTEEGNVRIDNLDSNLDLDIGYGIKDVLVGNCRNLKLKGYFCKDIKVGNCKNADIELRTSTLEALGEVEKLNLDCRFSDFTGVSAKEAKVYLHSSSFEMKSINNLELNRGRFSKNIRLDSVSHLSISELHSSNLKIKKVSDFEADNIKFSTIDIEEISDCSIKYSHSSKFYIDKINNVDIDDAKFSHFRINELAKSFICESQSGDINIGSVSADFQSIKVDGIFVNIDVDFGGCSYMLNVDLQHPNIKVADKKFKAGVDELQMSSFFVGHNKNTKSTVRFDCNKCKIRLE